MAQMAMSPGATLLELSPGKNHLLPIILAKKRSSNQLHPGCAKV